MVGCNSFYIDITRTHTASSLVADVIWKTMHTTHQVNERSAIITSLGYLPSEESFQMVTSLSFGPKNTQNLRLSEIQLKVQ